jgi:putative transposase
MKKSRFTESQIVKAIKEHENGRNVNELCRELGVSPAPLLEPSVTVRYPCLT